jgi:hypothetical protein
LFSPGGSCIPSTVTLVSSSPSKVGQFSFEYYPLSHEGSAGIHCLPCFGRLACCPTPTLSLCASSDLCLVLAAPLGGQLDAPPSLSAFVALPIFVHWEFSSLPTPALRGRFSVPPPPPLLVLDYSSLFMLFSFVGGGSIQSTQVLH